jgi:hypothetical protein
VIHSLSGLSSLRRRRFVAPVGGFSPADIAGLQIWLKADAITGLNDGEPVATWNDSSINGRNLTQATSTKRPLYKTAVQNGLPVMRFDGVDDYLQATFTLNQPTQLFVVYKIRTPSNGVIDFDGAIGLTALREDTVGGLSVISVFGYEGIVYQGGVADGSFHLIEVVWDQVSGFNSSISMDGGPPDIGNAGSNTSPGGVTMGAYNGGTLNAEIDVAEYILYSPPIAVGNAVLVMTYLKDKWATP